VKKTVVALKVAGAIALLSGSTYAGAAAFALYEQGVSGLGNAYAGAAAVAEDATTVWWNPAGMARLPRGRHFAVAGSLISPSTKFSNGSSVAPGARPLGTEGGDAGDSAFVPSLFFAMDFNPTWSFGLGVSVPFGLSTEYSPDWIGRFQGIESEIKTINVNPAVSYKVSERLSLGFGINYQQADIKTLTAVNLGLAEAQNRLKVDGDSWGFNAGILFNVAPATRLGVHYRSSIDFELEGSTNFTAPAPATLNSGARLDVKTPASLAFSAAHRLDDRWELLADLTWWEWSKIKQVPVVRTDGPAAGGTAGAFVFDFDDTWRASVGANYRLDKAWTLKVGVAYDQTPVPSAEARTVRLPDSDRYWLSAGAKYQLSRAGAIDAGYTFVKARDAQINNNQGLGATGAGLVNGEYKADVHIFGLQYQHSF
jgi:long-chain fatty acid transport protein